MPPVIKGGKIIITKDLKVNNSLETRKINITPRSIRILIIASNSFNLPYLPG